MAHSDIGSCKTIQPDTKGRVSRLIGTGENIPGTGSIEVRADTMDLIQRVQEPIGLDVPESYKEAIATTTNRKRTTAEKFAMKPVGPGVQSGCPTLN